MKKKKPVRLHDIRQAVADYMRSEGCGCGCCGDQDAHTEHKTRLAKLLRIPKYRDGSGYDFGRFETKRENP